MCGWAANFGYIAPWQGTIYPKFAFYLSFATDDTVVPRTGDYPKSVTRCGFPLRSYVVHGPTWTP